MSTSRSTGGSEGGSAATNFLEMALRASIRGLEALQEEQRTRISPPAPAEYYHVLQEMRQDGALLRAFIEAECRLLEDLGVSTKVVKRLRQSLAQTLLELDPEREGWARPSSSISCRVCAMIFWRWMSAGARGRGSAVGRSNRGFGRRANRSGKRRDRSRVDSSNWWAKRRRCGSVCSCGNRDVYPRRAEGA
jgi:hypothetical protein